MKTIIATCLVALSAALLPLKTVYDFTMKDIDGKDVALEKYKGKVLLIINVASFCGNTPQYKAIEELYKKYQGQGLVVLGFPANNFMGQEPGSNSEIKSFCTTKYSVTFPMFSKISVKGGDIAPLYSYLTQKSENGVIDAPVKWNFQKFLVGRDGKVITSFAPKTEVTEQEVITAIEKALKN
ncbi:MAG TPA: glutathione peroxidase [Chitinophagales bacterium]|nr:glutathione peroxidase [Chitinophagales bacterium]